MPPTSRRPVFSLGAAPRRLSGVALLVSVVVLGGAVAAVYTTGVVLGSRIAPRSEARAAGETPTSTAPGGGTDPAATDAVEGATTTEGQETTLPDRATGTGTTVAGADDPTRPGDPTEGASPDPAGSAYPAVWPYASWSEVTDHMRRGDSAYSTAEDTALRFAREIVGAVRPVVAGVRPNPLGVTVDVASGGGRSAVTLTNPAPTGVAGDAPWGVVGATGDVAVRSASAAGATVAAQVAGSGPVTVGVHDRRAWRGLMAAASGSTSVPVTPGPSGRAMVVALGGDPRDPSTFAVAPVDLAGGAPAPAAPGDVVAATRALTRAVVAGDVGAVWELLDAPARRTAVDWRGVAARIPDLRTTLAPFAGELVTTDLATEVGPVSVVVPAAAPSGPTPGGLAFRAVSGGFRLSALDAAEASWTAPTPAAPALAVQGVTRPALVAVDGTIRSAESTGDGGLRVVLDDLAAGDHLAVAVFVGDGGVTVAAFGFTTADPVIDETPAEPDPPTPSAEPDATPDRAADPLPADSPETSLPLG